MRRRLGWEATLGAASEKMRARRTFCVDRSARTDGTHLVHEIGNDPSPCLPGWEERLFLGIRERPEDAVFAARDVYPHSDACANCMGVLAPTP